MAATDLRTLMVICVVLNYLCHYGNSFVILDSADKDPDNVRQIEENVEYLLKILEQLRQISPLPEDRLHESAVSGGSDTRYEHDPTELRRLLQTLQETREGRINVSKKDFAILPPASEWCRMMGFRRCRTSDSH